MKWYINIDIWVRSRRCDCLVTWFCYQLIAKPGNKAAAPSWPDPYQIKKVKVLRVKIRFIKQNHYISSDLLRLTVFKLEIKFTKWYCAVAHCLNCKLQLKFPEEPFYHSSQLGLTIRLETSASTYSVFPPKIHLKCEVICALLVFVKA